jgi:hypothetical protein
MTMWVGEDQVSNLTPWPDFRCRNLSCWDTVSEEERAGWRILDVIHAVHALRGPHPPRLTRQRHVDHRSWKGQANLRFTFQYNL